MSIRNQTEIKFQEWMKNKNNPELGKMLREYISESNHQGWDGFSQRDRTSMRNLFSDMMLYWNSRLEDLS